MQKQVNSPPMSNVNNLWELNFIFTYKKALPFSPSLRGEAEAIQSIRGFCWIASASPRNDEDGGFLLFL